MDPTGIIPPHSPQAEDKTATMESILSTQLKLAAEIQKKLQGSQDDLTTRDYKDLVGAASNIVSLAHRTEEALKTIRTYRLFTETVLEFLRSRSDSLGEDLLAELKRVSKELNSDGGSSGLLDF